MRFLCLYKPGHESTGAPTQQEIDAMGALIGEMSQAGVLVQTEGCQPSSKGARVRINGGQFTVVDGPFAESKELVGGMAVIEVQSNAEAIEWTKRFLTVAGRGEARSGSSTRCRRPNSERRSTMLWAWHRRRQTWGPGR